MPKSLLMDSTIGVNLTPDGSLATPQSSDFLWDSRARGVARGRLGFDARVRRAKAAPGNEAGGRIRTLREPLRTRRGRREGLDPAPVSLADSAVIPASILFGREDGVRAEPFTTTPTNAACGHVLF
jgi:hypothetical protein